MRRLKLLGMLLLPAFAADAQTARPVFEVAAIRSVGHAGPPCCMGGGPGTGMPGRIRYQRVTLMQIIQRAYGVEAYQVRGPKWLFEELYEVLAPVPPNTSQETFALMHQSLLEERWGLKMHRETASVEVIAIDSVRATPTEN